MPRGDQTTWSLVAGRSTSALTPPARGVARKRSSLDSSCMEAAMVDSGAMPDQEASSTGRRPQAFLLGLGFITLFFAIGPYCAIRLNMSWGWPVWSSPLGRVLGGVLALAGAGGAAYCANLFARVGRGTPVPIDPPRQLVVGGPYRYSRNPIYLAEVLILIGFFLFFGHPALLLYTILLALLVQLPAVVFLEEPVLLRRFGDDYAAYMRHVPRWLGKTMIPRVVRCSQSFLTIALLLSTAPVAAVGAESGQSDEGRGGSNAGGVVAPAVVDLVIQNARLIDGTGGDPIVGATILVSEGHVLEVLTGPSHHIGRQTIDAKGFTVVPGLTDAHTHVLVEYPGAKGESIFRLTPDLPVDGPEQVQDYIENRLPTRMRRYLEAGVTTILDNASYRPFILDVRDKVNRGEIVGPRMFVVGPAFAAPGGHPGAGPICASKPWCARNLTISTNDPAQARRAVDELADEGVDGIKLVCDDLRVLGGPYPKMKPEVLKAIVDQGHRRSLPVVAHVITSKDAGVVVDAGVDGLVHTPIKDLFSYTAASGESIPALLKRNNIPVISTVRIDTDGAPFWMKAAMIFVNPLVFRPTFHALKDAGVVIVLGTDFAGIGPDPQPGIAVRKEAEALVALGFKEGEVIQMATGNAGRFPLIPGTIGTIVPGSYADLLLLEGDPLKDISALFAPTVVVKEGKIVIDKRR